MFSKNVRVNAKRADPGDFSIRVVGLKFCGVFPVRDRVISLLLRKLPLDRAGRISALGHFYTDLTAFRQSYQGLGPIDIQSLFIVQLYIYLDVSIGTAISTFQSDRNSF